MALDCSAETLAVNSANLTGSLSFKQLLAALVYIQCTSNGMSCDAQTLSVASRCLYNCLSEKQLLAALLYIQCTTGGSGGGGGNKITVAVTDPVGNGTTAGDLWINELSAQEWYWSGSAWNQLIGP